MSTPCAPTTPEGQESPVSNGAVAVDPALVADGWERRYLADENRAAEARELYTSLGYEVLEGRLEPDDFGPACGECALVVCPTHVMIYTRKAGEGRLGQR